MVFPCAFGPLPSPGVMGTSPPAYEGMQPQAHVQQRPQAGGTAWGAQEGKGEEHRRACERLAEADRSLKEREARVTGGRAGRRRGGRKGQAGRRRGSTGSGGAAEGVGGPPEKAGEG